jgi:hypothetical protein
MADIRQQLREHGREQIEAIGRRDPEAPQMRLEEFRVGFEQYVNDWLAHTGQGAPFKMEFTSTDRSPHGGGHG